MRWQSNAVRNANSTPRNKSHRGDTRFGLIHHNGGW
jgi:hypothetical protein